MRSQSAYNPIKRLRRATLKLAGRWSRADYDVRIGVENGAATRKYVTFASLNQAQRVADALATFEDSPHVPALYERNGATVSTEFVAGSLCHPMTDKLMPDVARCLGHINNHGAYDIQLSGSDLWQAHIERLDYLHSTGVINQAFYTQLRDASESRAPNRLGMGFDYADPISPNLVFQADTQRVCVIDIKNLHGHRPTGLGIAKVASKWLHAGRRPAFFDALNEVSGPQVEQNFDFLCLFEHVQRAARKTASDIRYHRWFRKTVQRRDELHRLTNTLVRSPAP